jgi:hypothetical protein
VANIISVTIMTLVTPKAGAKHKLLFNKLASGSCNLAVMYNHFHKNHNYDLGHTLLCYKIQSPFFNKSSGLAGDSGVTEFTRNVVIIWSLSIIKIKTFNSQNTHYLLFFVTFEPIGTIYILLRFNGPKITPC